MTIPFFSRHLQNSTAAALNSDVLFLACMDLSVKNKCIGLCFVFRFHTVMMSKDGQVPPPRLPI